MFTYSCLVQHAPLRQRVYLVFMVKWLKEIIYLLAEFRNTSWATRSRLDFVFWQRSCDSFQYHTVCISSVFVHAFSAVGVVAVRL